MKIRFFIPLLASLFCSDLAAMEKSNIAEEVHKAHSTIGHKQPFVAFSLCLSEQDKNILQSLKIDNVQKPYNNFGCLENLSKEVAQFLQSLGNSEKEAFAGAKIIESIVTQSLKGLNAQTAWVTIRAFESQDTFDLPRWHRDGYYYTPFEGPQHKIACALQGAGTLFCNVSKEVRSQFQQIENQGMLSEEQFEKLTEKEIFELMEVTRIKLANLLQQYTFSQATGYEGALFIVGEEKSAAIHSEPPIHSNRLFMSILPGTHEQIKELDQKWNQAK